jgi:hypothetical protein
MRGFAISRVQIRREVSYRRKLPNRPRLVLGDFGEKSQIGSIFGEHPPDPVRFHLTRDGPRVLTYSVQILREFC